ncbi:hypothetical protein KKG22_04625 [Patescibacteria group bacterium]|nr:hypothetical protein [Patescibacteria group bacterium]MBU1721621.1 hypothetical protein [Patescibacteria group bacterium]MBU1901717.1 hypothetical protein [Patescibacteria group bacterium]
MLFSRDYRRPFWLGFAHALLVVVYVLFVTLISLQLKYLYQGEIAPLIQMAVGFFLVILSAAMCGWLIFFEPIKSILQQHFKAGTVMLLSTIGWLFVFLTVFIMGLVMTMA